MDTEYVQVDADTVPHDKLRWVSPKRLQGQFVETEYGFFGAVGGAAGDPYMRTRDLVAGDAWTYYRAGGGDRA